MIYLITKMIAYLIAASLIGLSLGWILRSIGVEKSKKLLEYSHQDKLDAITEQHQEELAEFAETAKQSRANSQRLETNNKALRETIHSNAAVLESAQTEVSQLLTKLKTSDAFNKEILAVTGHSAEEFDKTMEVQEHSLDTSNMALSESTLDDSLVSTQDRTMTEAESICDSEIVDDTEQATVLTDEKEQTNAPEEPVEITMGNLWSHIGQVVGTKKTKN